MPYRNNLFRNKIFSEPIRLIFFTILSLMILATSCSLIKLGFIPAELRAMDFLPSVKTQSALVEPLSMIAIIGVKCFGFWVKGHGSGKEK